MAKNDEKIRINIAPSEHGELRSVDFDSLRDAGWTDDPGQGHAVMLPDERGNPAYEVLSPLVFAPPIGYEATPPIEELIAARVRAEFDRLKDEDQIDDIIDAEDFDIPDEDQPLETIYEMIAMKPETPALPKDSKPDLSEKVKMDLEYEEMLARERVNRRRNREAALRRQMEEDAIFNGPSGGSDPGGSRNAPPDVT